MDYSATGRRPYFTEEDDGLVSLVDMEAGFSGNHYPQSFFSRSKLCHRRDTVSSPRMSSTSSARRFYGSRFEDHHYHHHHHHHHFLEACFLCKKPLGDNKDIFMYRGDTPFCSEECREKQIEIDGAKEKKINLSSSIKALRKKDQKKSASPDKSTAHDCRFRTTTTIAAA